MINYVEYLKVPSVVAASIIGVVFFMQIVGEALALKGKVVPEIMTLRKRFSRKKKEKEALHELVVLMPTLKEVPGTLGEVKTLLADVNEHYGKDNITMRNEWMQNVNERLEQVGNLAGMLEKNSADTLEVVINIKRNAILDFAALVVQDKPVTREQFHRIFNMYNEYEETLAANKRTNGETDIAIRIIRESYEEHLRNRTFVEDIRGYNV